jgi:subtilisin family serine protease
VRDLKQVNTMVVSAPASVRTSLAADRRALGVARGGVRKLTVEDPTSAPNLSRPGTLGATRLRAKAPAAATASGINPDPAWDYKGLLWDYRRIGLPKGWKTTAGSSKVTVGVADTGLDFTHSELGPKVKQVIDFAGLEDPPGICKEAFGVSDEDLAAEFGGPVTTDWIGHGSWIGGRIAAALNGTGINGIAPQGQPGRAEDLPVVWLGQRRRAPVGVRDRRRHGPGHRQHLLRRVPGHLHPRGGAHLPGLHRRGRLRPQQGHDHRRLGRQRTRPRRRRRPDSQPRRGNRSRDPARGLRGPFGQITLPGGAPGYVDVAATGRVNVPSSASCPPGTIGDPGDPDADPPVPPDFNATCKPTSDRHQAAGPNTTNQLTYYSNFGPRIDIAAPGGARKFNLPNWDRGGTPGFPYTLDDLTNAWQVFSTTSNWAVDIPCFTFTKGSGFPQGECYSTIQGTSMAAPQVVGSLALVASGHPSLRKHPWALIARLKRMANDGPTNRTRDLSATDTSPGDLTGLPCETGFCHLQGPRISDSDAYGAGLVNVANP